MDAGKMKMQQVSFAYNKQRPVLEKINLDISPGESVGVVGANGVGKSTLLRLLTGLNLDFEGKIQINETEVSKDTLKEIRKHIGYVFQDADNQLFMSNVYEDVAFAPGNYGKRGSELDNCVKEALKATGIEHLASRQIYQLSGGEKKLVSLAGILSMEPGIILLDEPSAALDPRNRRNLIHLLNQFTVTKVITAHDLDFILDTCERTILLYEGRIVKDGPSKEILLDKELMYGCGLELPLRYEGQ